jgi:trehalose 6-phosphate phosphatase
LDALDEIESRMARAEHVLVCVDFDGPLAAIQPNPDSAAVGDRLKRALETLAKAPDTSLVIISGRSRSDIQERVGIPGVIYVGNHGLEISGDGFLFVEPGAAAHRPALHELAGELAKRLEGMPGVAIEDKGLSLSVHYRQVPDALAEQLRQAMHAVLANSSHPFVLAAGDKVHEIRPRVYWDKPAALRWIKEQLQKPDALILYVSDATTDEEVFAALTEQITVRVGAAGESAAHYRLGGPADVEQFLGRLARDRAGAVRSR